MKVCVADIKCESVMEKYVNRKTEVRISGKKRREKNAQRNKNG